MGRCVIFVSSNCWQYIKDTDSAGGGLCGAGLHAGRVGGHSAQRPLSRGAAEAAAGANPVQNQWRPAAHAEAAAPGPSAPCGGGLQLEREMIRSAEEKAKRQRVQEKLRKLGVCPMNFEWIAVGYRDVRGDRITSVLRNSTMLMSREPSREGDTKYMEDLGDIKIDIHVEKYMH